MILLTQELRRILPAIRSQEYVEDPMVYVKYFTPWAGWTWYVTEGGPVLDEKNEEIDYEFFGLVDGDFVELGSFVLSELESVKGSVGLKIERDLHFKPTRLSEVRKRCNGMQ